MKQLPSEFLEQMKKMLGDEFDSYLKSYEKPRFYGLRVNTNKISVEDFLKISPFSLTPIPWTHNGFYYGEEERPAKHPYYYAGLYYLQEPSAMLPAEALPVEETDFVLDVCAAPGGKSTALVNKNPRVLLSNDISNSRAQALLKNLELFGAVDMLCFSEDPLKFADRFTETFDKILIDAPCSGEGMFRKEPAVVNSWVEHGHDYYIGLQKQITASCLKMLKKGGMLLYSTCTFSVSEDEDMVAYMKSLCPELQVVKIPDPSGVLSRGIPDTDNVLSKEELESVIRIFPHRTDGEGHFAALLKKGEKEAESVTPGNKVLLSEIAGFTRLPEECKDFLGNVTKTFKNGTFELRNDKLALVPELPVALKGLRIVRNGLYLGEVKKNRFEPSQSLAMALKSTEFKANLDLSIDDPNVIKYLKGETLVFQSEPSVSDGFVLVSVGGFPLGFGKKSGTMVKNKYLAGWRMQF